MKKKILYLLLSILGVVPVAQAQKSGFSISLGANDFYGPQTHSYFFIDRQREKLDEAGALDTVSSKSLYWRVFGRVAYWHQINKHVDVSLHLTIGNVDYPLSSKDSDFINRATTLSAAQKFTLLLELDGRINYNILSKEDHLISPYLFAGISGSMHNPYYGATIPLGIGANVNLTKNHDLFLNLESGYKIAATSHDQNHLQHTFGFVYWYKPHYKEPDMDVKPTIADAVTQLKVADADGDGIPDDKDECPSVPGLAQFNGCPDSDGDGIPDNKDECPLVAGLAQFNGCPDTDGDGIPDQKDKCPYVAGSIADNGCPPPDADNDGVPDAQDRCPNVAGPASNQGCPEIKKEVITQVERAAKAIFFETGKTTIKKQSFKQLDVVVGIMKNDPTLFADIEGHTDNVQGKAINNMELSQKRAEAVRDYFATKGIDASRLTAQGFGDTQPVADNSTAVGKAQNRRTVIKLRNFSK